jgi:hypothetical protein
VLEGFDSPHGLDYVTSDLLALAISIRTLDKQLFRTCFDLSYSR